MTIYSQSQIYSLAMSVGVPSQNALIASAVAMAESGGNAQALNPGSSSDYEYSVGLWQINLLAHPQYTVTQMYDPTQNAKAMSVISNGGTYWGAWGAYNNGSYRKYMNTTITADALPASPSSYSTLSSSTGAPVNYLDAFTGTSLTSTTNPATTTDVGSAWTYILAYLVVILICVFVSRFQAGYNALYYMAVLFLLLLLVTMAPFIANALKPITQPSATDSSTITV